MAADVFEIYVDAVRAGCMQLGSKVLGRLPVIDADIKA